ISWTSNPRDVALLRATWTEDFEILYNIGSGIFHHLFDGPNGTESKTLFPWIAKYEEEGIDYVQTNDFRVLCLRLVQTVAIFLEEVGDKAKVEVFLYKLGARHVNYLPHDLPPACFETLRESVHFGLNERINSLPRLTKEERERAIHIWADTVVYIFHLVQEGFYDALRGFDRFPHIHLKAASHHFAP
ncbi:hypothetical protein PMAYCL1PPCAC_16131, partial [Pristionchus mayeri]